MRTRSADDKLKWSTALGVLLAGAADPRSGDVAAVGRSVAERIFGELETDADNRGFQMTIGYDANEAPRVFEILLGASDQDDDDIPYVFASHPRLRERIQTYRLLIEVNEGVTSIKGRVGTTEYLDSIDPLVLDCAQMHIDDHQWQKAEATIDRFLERHPDSARAYFLKGEVFRTSDMQGHGGEALAQYERAMALDGTPADTYRSVGLIYRARGDHVKASEAFRRYLSESPGAVDAPIASSYLIDVE
jgi:predicted Zn-dependent protease